MRRKACIGLIFLLSVLPFAYADAPYDVYVSDHALSGDVLSKNGKIYVEASPLAAALGLPIQMKNGSINVNGKSFNDAFQSKGKWYVALKPFAQTAGNQVIVNSETKIIDVVPASSGMTQKTAEQLASAAHFAPEPQAKALLSAASSPGRHSLSDLLQTVREIAELSKDNSDILQSHPDIENYIKEIAQWSQSNQAFLKKIHAQLAQAKVIQDPAQRLDAIKILIKEYDGEITQMQQSFAQIQIPPEFATSNAAFRRMLGRLTDMSNLLKRLILNPDSVDFDKETYGILGPLLDDTAEYLAAYRDDLKKFIEANRQ